MSTSTIENLAKVFRVNKDALKPEETDGKPGTIVKEFCLNTSAHGLAGIARSRNICNCLFWTIPTLGFMGVMIFLIIQAVMDYLGYPTQTSVEIINTWPLPFPAVTVCNRAPIRFDAILGPFLNYTNTTEYSPELLGSLLSFLRASEEASNFSGEYFFSLSSMLISCTYNGIKCSPDNFTTFSVRQYGLCYTFNAKLKSASGGGVHYISDYGSTGELKMEFYVHRHQYIPFVQRGEGMVAMLHDNDRMPSLSNAAMLLGTHQHHRWNYRNRAFSFLPAPFTTCTNKINLAMQTLYDQYQAIEYGYSLTVCFDICLQTYIYDDCGCISPDVWHIRSIVPLGTTTVVNPQMCDEGNICWVDRSKQFLQDTSVWETYCKDCGEECSYTDFIVQPTSMPISLEYDLPRIKEFVDQSNVTLPESWSENYATEIPKSYVSIEILTESTRVEKYTQQRSVGLVDLISNIGGQTGLWIGISFLSLFELLEMIVRLCIVHYRTVRQRFQRDQQRPDVLHIQL